MKKFVFLSLFILIATSQASAQTPEVIKFDRLQAMLSRQNDTTYLYNFFATWCGACVKEFSNFQKFADENAGKKFKLVFVSLDFVQDIDKSLIPFVKKKNVAQEVYLLDETDYNSWINNVDTTWSGGLPASLVVNSTKGIHKLYPQEFSLAELEQAVKPSIP
jgi:thiol-disulfide isomerase/thioredoxin